MFKYNFIEPTIYDDAGNEMTTYDALGKETINSYDQRGRLICTTDSLGNTTKYTYDNAGNIITKTDGNYRKPNPNRQTAKEPLLRKLILTIRTEPLRQRRIRTAI